ncbi:MAG: aromatic ring-hydroxylating dioxygenase subunit alpha [Chloroflexota bacterium]
MSTSKYEWPNRKLEEAYTLPSRYFYEPAIMEDEKWAIFYKSWRLVAHVSEVVQPRQFVTCEIFDQSILIVRGDDNTLRAFHNVCQHRGNKLVTDPRGQSSRSFVCSYHAWSYGTDGSLLGAPRTERLENFNKADNCLKSVRVQEFAGFVFINLDEHAESMEDLFPGAAELILEHAPDMANLKFESQYDLVAPINWKVAMDNGIEAYHLMLSGPAHKELTHMLDFKQFLPQVHDNWWALMGPPKPGLTEVYGVEIGDSPYQTDHFINTWLFPNTAIYCVPYVDYVATFLVIPLEAEKTLLRFGYYVPDREETPLTVAARDWMNDQLGPEDIELNLTTQQGLKSFGFDQGRYMIDPERSNESEYAVHHFHTKVYEALIA